MQEELLKADGIMEGQIWGRKMRAIKSDFAMTFEKALSQYAVMVRKFYNEVDWPLSALYCSIYWWFWSGRCVVWMSCDKGFIKQCCLDVIWIK